MSEGSHVEVGYFTGIHRMYIRKDLLIFHFFNRCCTMFDVVVLKTQSCLLLSLALLFLFSFPLRVEFSYFSKLNREDMPCLPRRQQYLQVMKILLLI